MAILSNLLSSSYAGAQGVQGIQGIQGVQGTQGIQGPNTGITLKSNGVTAGTSINNVDFVGADISVVGAASTITVSAGSDITSSLF